MTDLHANAEYFLAKVGHLVGTMAHHANVVHSQEKVVHNVETMDLHANAEMRLAKVVHLEEMVPSVLVVDHAWKRLQSMGQNVYRRSWLRLGSARDVLANSLCLKAA
jgi:hypothetical protein